MPGKSLLCCTRGVASVVIVVLLVYSMSLCSVHYCVSWHGLQPPCSKKQNWKGEKEQGTNWPKAKALYKGIYLFVL